MNMHQQTAEINPRHGNKVSRRSILGAGMAAFMVGATKVEATTPDPQTEGEPFLHVLDGPIPDTHYELNAGDMVLVLPGVGPWDDMHLLRDGRFAAVQVPGFGSGDVGINMYGSEDRFYVSPAKADKLIAGRVVTRLRLHRGRWVA